MSIHHHTTYSYELQGEILPLPFNTNSDPEREYLSENGLHAVLAFLVQDECPNDPFTEYDEGEFYQFNNRYDHHTSSPDLEEWKRIIRANPGRVISVQGSSPDYRAGELVTPAMCRNRTAHNNDTSDADYILDRMSGYYIAPADGTNPLQYATGSIENYSQWCSGEVYGVVVWEYTRDSIADSWQDPDRDQECWGYYGGDGYTADELRSQFIAAVTHGAPSREANRLRRHTP
jgi:hypothetical protein